MSEELVQHESHSQPSIFSRFFKMFSFVFPLLNVIKIIIASVTSLVFLAFSFVTLGGSAVALIVSTPLFIIFSPILVPATITTTLLASGLMAGTTLGLTGIGLITGIFRTAGGVTLASSPLRKIIIDRIKARLGGGGGGSRLAILKKILGLVNKYRSMASGGAAAAPAAAPAADAAPAAAPAPAPAAAPTY
ncbi:hypothetical protein HA466_0002180 [Hirschfeldia incana]|nr:hypothetical protein HA466_0002180 [Hirschfeldia incana]